MVPVPAGPVRRRRRAVLLQAVGRSHPKSGRARARRAHPRRHAAHHHHRQEDPVKLTMPGDALAAATGWVSAVARPAKAYLPALAGIMLTAGPDGTVTVAGTDWQTTATARA